MDQFEGSIPAAAKATIDFATVAERLKPCPFKAHSDSATTEKWDTRFGPGIDFSASALETSHNSDRIFLSGCRTS
jgi:hypothetical protein